GDPRADHILRRLPKNGQARTAVRAFTTLLNIPPNIDMALAAMVRHLGCPAHAAQTVFAVARTAGWCAHALEQRESGEMIRPRAQFVP
ncbi:MAG: citrate/2-methylcitrate synthase, partial [Pseudomonadota bacterium]